MPRKKPVPPNPSEYIQCPLNLDGIIMAPTTTPDIVELNCALGDELLFDAIRLCTCSYWLFKLDILEKFSKQFRTRLYSCLPALPRITRQYFNYQLENSSQSELLEEYQRFILETGYSSGSSGNLNNPLTMLGNDIKELDLQILNGKLTPRQMLLDRIQTFLQTKNKDAIDFSYSLFLPELLNPKFFQELSEAEHIVLVGNLSKYFEFLSKFFKMGFGFRGTIKPRSELNPPQLLIKHILADERGIYTNRVKMMAWNQLCQEQDKLSSRETYKLFVPEELDRNWKELFDKLTKKGLDTLMTEEWLKAAEGVFESFELDCTLHNVDATDFLLIIMTDKRFSKMARGLMEFQDSDTRNRLFKAVANAMTPFR